MRLKLFYLCLGLLGWTAITSCSDDNDSTPLPQVPDKCLEAFAAKYPSVNNAKWEKEGNYYVAEYINYNNTVEVEAWFKPDGSWAMSETDYRKDLFMIPTAVNKGYVLDSGYGTSPVDDIKYYEYPDSSKDFYLIEVEQNGAPDMGLYFKPDGTLIKTAPDSGIDITPDTTI